MRFAFALLALAGLAGGMFSLQGGDEQVVLLSGDTQGYLSPCGCSSPMVGGIRRRAAVIRSLSIPGRTTILENGGLVDAAARQDQMKAETIVQSMADLGVTAINIGPADARLGPGSILQLSQMSGNKLVSLNIPNPQAHGIVATIASGPFIVGGATDYPQSAAALLGEKAVPIDDAVSSLVQSADESHQRPFLMLQGGHASAVRLARKFPALALIQYSSIGDPPDRLERVGETVLATTGEHGKHVVRLVFRDGRFEAYRSIVLGPDYKDDPAVSRFYSTYLRRVTDEKLIERVLRHPTAPFAGSAACASCHPSAAHIWKGSRHRIAYQTLEKIQHGADPDCVSCHVVGLDSTKGFRSLSTTPQLAAVGCESCHGPALAHSLHPNKVKLSTIGQKACVGCHNPLNSPNFDFATYWRKIKHS